MPHALLLLAVLTAGVARAADASPPRAASADPSVASTPAPPATWRDPVAGIEMVYVTGGCYRMGDPTGLGKVVWEEFGAVEEPAHEVCLDGYYIGKYELTQGQWRKIMGSVPESDAPADQDDLPVVFVTYQDIQAFIEKLNTRSAGGRFRLPTEAEWEYAARSRGRTDHRYAGGNDLDSVSWYTANSARADGRRVRRTVGQKLPNELGLHDMSGNVWEVVADWFAPKYYAESPRDNPRGPASGTAHVKRGGCATGSPVNQRLTMREPFEISGTSGFRLARVP